MYGSDFSTLFDLLPIGAYRSSADGRQLRANAALVRLNGYATEAEMLLAVSDIAQEWYVDPKRRREFREQIERDGQVVNFRSEVYRHNTRERIWILENAHAVRDDAGTVRYFEGTVQEVTQAHRAQLALESSERRFRALTEKAQVLTVVCTAGGEVMYASPAARAMLGRDPDTLRGSNVFDWIHPDERLHARDEQSRVLAHANSGMESIYRYRHADGRWRYLASLASNCLEDDAVRGVVLNFRDATERRRAERAELALRENETRWKLALESAGDGVWDWDLLTGVELYSSRFKEMYGFEEDELTALTDEMDQRVHPDDRDRRDRARQAHLDGLTASYVDEHRVRSKDGSWKWVLSRGMVIGRDARGKPLRMIGTHTDITERKQAEAALRESEERWKLALDSTGDGVWDWDLQTGIETFSRRCREMYGYAEGEMSDLAADFDLRTHPDDLVQMQRDRQAHFDGLTPTYINEHRLRCKDGSWKWVLSRGMVISRGTDGQPLRMIGTHTDITERKNSETLIWQQANFDTLTGLPNRRMLRDRLEQQIKKSDREGLQLAILFIDLDHFKEVNDTLGHDAGDALLVEAATRIRRCVRDSDTVARMGGDEFTLVLSELHDGERLERILQNLLDTLSSLYQIGNEQVYISASIGITIYPEDASEVENLFKNADQALYVAKGAGRNRFSFFTPALQEAAQNRVRLANDLRMGLTEQQFRVAYQPIVNLRTGAIRKAEALLRWQHPSRGLINPADFIPVAESSGLIIDIGEWVFRQAAAQVQHWRTVHDADFQISINKSPVQYHNDAGRQKSWIRHLRSLGLAGDSMVMEITEGLLLDTSTIVTDQLLELRDAGVQVSLDDFGTGYSSLTYLQKFDIDYIKIDQSFVRNLVAGSTDLALCKAIIVMAHELDMQVIAEGVETAGQRDLLVAAGCDYAQGFFFSHALPAEEFDTFMARWQG